MVFEVVFFFASLSVLGIWLFAREALTDWRHRYRANRLHVLLPSLEGKPVSQAETLLGPPAEIVNGAAGRCLFVWKGPVARVIPNASTLLILTLTVESNGVVSHAAWEER